MHKDGPCHTQLKLPISYGSESSQLFTLDSTAEFKSCQYLSVSLHAPAPLVSCEYSRQHGRSNTGRVNRRVWNLTSPAV